MAWARFDDQFWVHPKVQRLSDKAHRLWVRSIGYSAQFLTDGLLDATALRDLCATPRLCDELCAPLRPGESGLWEVVTDGYQIHDYLDYNPSRADVIARRKKESDKKAVQRAAANHHPITGRFTA